MIINRGSFVSRSTMVESSRVGLETTDMGRTSKLEQSQKPKENNQREKHKPRSFFPMRAEKVFPDLIYFLNNSSTAQK